METETKTQGAAQPQITSLADALAMEPPYEAAPRDSEPTPVIAPMTFAQLYAALRPLLGSLSFCMDVELWNHDHGAGETPTIKTKWKVYVCWELEPRFCEAPTSNELLDVVRARLAAMPAEPAIPTAVINVGDVPASTAPAALAPLDDDDIPF